MIKVLMLSRSTLYTAPGGDTIQIVETANHLIKLNVKVDIKLTNDKTIEYGDYNLIHFFNIIRPNDILGHIRKSNIPFVISTIFVDYSEYEKKLRKGALGFLGKFLSADFVEYFKVIARYLKNGEKIGDFSYLILGHKRSIQKILKKACCLLPNSESEYKRLYAIYNVKNQYIVIPNALNIETFKNTLTSSQKRNGVICVARIEGLKNQLNLIKAINETNYSLTIIGNPSPNSIGYYEQCMNEASKNVDFISHLTQEELNEYYNKAKVHILPSWFETTGLSSLEAGYLGCNIVVTDKGDVKEYFKDFATYCDPFDIQSIRKAIIVAYEKENSPDLKEYILNNYTWDITAKKTKEAYLGVLNRN
ncbi:glycosyltransferase family 4 protein [uncultured Maribacter sp.]|uniref:glycosyltransferase family 4 protein n=1 Tax=uncultured Maribacter sp. TaxID=431308 RepID=UPI0030ED807D|tara:strand:+ start:86700 stop:87788 length:1089 start_codon:yes stop_codon:yes gene_type:complete